MTYLDKLIKVLEYLEKQDLVSFRSMLGFSDMLQDILLSFSEEHPVFDFDTGFLQNTTHSDVLRACSAVYASMGESLRYQVSKGLKNDVSYYPKYLQKHKKWEKYSQTIPYALTEILWRMRLSYSDNFDIVNKISNRSLVIGNESKKRARKLAPVIGEFFVDNVLRVPRLVPVFTKENKAMICDAVYHHFRRKFSESSFRKYISFLNKQGILRIAGNEGNTYYYAIGYEGYADLDKGQRPPVYKFIKNDKKILDNFWKHVK